MNFMLVKSVWPVRYVKVKIWRLWTIFVIKWGGTEEFSVVKRSCIVPADSPLVVGARVSVKVSDANGRKQVYDGDILARGRSDGQIRVRVGIWLFHALQEPRQAWRRLAHG